MDINYSNHQNLSPESIAHFSALSVAFNNIKTHFQFSITTKDFLSNFDDYILYFENNIYLIIDNQAINLTTYYSSYIANLKYSALYNKDLNTAMVSDTAYKNDLSILKKESLKSTKGSLNRLLSIYCWAYAQDYTYCTSILSCINSYNTTLFTYIGDRPYIITYNLLKTFFLKNNLMVPHDSTLMLIYNSLRFLHPINDKWGYFVWSKIDYSSNLKELVFSKPINNYPPIDIGYKVFIQKNKLQDCYQYYPKYFDRLIRLTTFNNECVSKDMIYKTLWNLTNKDKNTLFELANFIFSCYSRTSIKGKFYIIKVPNAKKKIVLDLLSALRLRYSRFLNVRELLRIDYDNLLKTQMMGTNVLLINDLNTNLKENEFHKLNKLVNCNLISFDFQIKEKVAIDINNQQLQIDEYNSSEDNMDNELKDYTIIETIEKLKFRNDMLIVGITDNEKTLQYYSQKCSVTVIDFSFLQPVNLLGVPVFIDYLKLLLPFLSLDTNKKAKKSLTVNLIETFVNEFIIMDKLSDCDMRTLTQGVGKGNTKFSKCIAKCEVLEYYNLFHKAIYNEESSYNPKKINKDFREELMKNNKFDVSKINYNGKTPKNYRTPRVEGYLGIGIDVEKLGLYTNVSHEEVQNNLRDEISYSDLITLLSKYESSIPDCLFSNALKMALKETT